MSALLQFKLKTVEGDIRRFTAPSTVSFTEIKLKIENVIGRTVAQLAYRDDEGDQVTLSSDEELAFAVSLGGPVVRLFEGATEHAHNSSNERPNSTTSGPAGFDFLFPMFQEIAPVVQTLFKDAMQGAHTDQGNGAPWERFARAAPWAPFACGKKPCAPKCGANTSEQKAEAAATPHEEDVNLIELLPDPELKPGDWGLPVARLQKALVMLGYLEPQNNPRFGPKTESALKSYQRDNGIVETGEYDSNTATSMRSLFSFNHDGGKPASEPEPVASTSKAGGTAAAAPVEVPAEVVEPVVAHPTPEVKPSGTEPSAKPIPAAQIDVTPAPAKTTEPAPAPAPAAEAEPAPAPAAVSEEQTEYVVLDDGKWDAALSQLESMGFFDKLTNIQLLNEYQGDLRRVLMRLLDVPNH